MKQIASELIQSCLVTDYPNARLMYEVAGEELATAISVELHKAELRIQGLQARLDSAERALAFYLGYLGEMGRVARQHFTKYDAEDDTQLRKNEILSQRKGKE